MISAPNEMKRSEAVRVPGLLGLARRAGGVVFGTEDVREAIRAGRARLVLMARDAAPAQSGKVLRTLAGRPTHHASWGTREGLGAAVGLDPLSAIAITHADLAAEILDELESVTVSRAEA